MSLSTIWELQTAHIDLISSPDCCGGDGLCLVDLGGEGLYWQAPVSVHGPLAHGLVTEGAWQRAKAGQLGHASCSRLHAHHCSLPRRLATCKHPNPGHNLHCHDCIMPVEECSCADTGMLTLQPALLRSCPSIKFERTATDNMKPSALPVSIWKSAG